MPPIPFDYETLRILWWLLLGVLLIGFAIADGFDLGTGMLLPFVARNDGERRIVINTVGPVWEGNQVWFITGGGAIFAAWPFLYALSFSGFYLAMFLVLAALILRPVGFKYRSKMAGARWRAIWDWALFVGGLVPSLIFGVAFGNIIQGVPFHYEADSLRPIYEGGLLGLLNPFALLCGLTSVTMLVMHGGTWLAVKTSAPISERARNYGAAAALVLVVLFALGGFWVGYGIDGYAVTSAFNGDAPSNPLLKTVVREAGGWLANYGLHPWMMLAPFLGFVGAIGAFALLRWRKAGLAFICSALSIFGVISTAGLTVFPFLLPSSSNPSQSLTVFDASSSQTTLFIMLIAAVIFVPIILAYTAWVYRVMWGKVTAADIESNDNAY
jgi:cytochrome bd ubiquinol oxidase subunit II